MNDMLWNPPEENYQSSNLATFISFIQTKYEIKFEKNYDSLWKWSIKERKKFWLSLVEFLNLEYSGSNQPIIKEDQYIYNEEFFPNIKLSYAQNIIQNLNNNPIIFRNESNFKIQINKEEVVRKVAKLSFHLKSLGVVKGDRIAAIAANTPDTIISFLAVGSLYENSFLPSLIKDSSITLSLRVDKSI